MKQDQSPSKLRKTRLCIIFGAPQNLLAPRIDLSFSLTKPDSTDYLFVGLFDEFTRFKCYTRKKWPQIWKKINGKIAYVESYNTWTNLSYSRPSWKSYAHIIICSQYFHGLRIKRFMELLGRTKKLTVLDTKTSESYLARLFYWLEFSPLRIKVLNQIAKFFRKDLLSK